MITMHKMDKMKVLRDESTLWSLASLPSMIDDRVLLVGLRVLGSCYFVTT